MPREGFFDSAGVKLHYLDWGGTGTPLLFLAGLGGTAQWYRGLAPRLVEQYRILALTRRGHGRSEKPDGGYDLIFIAREDETVAAIREFQGVCEA